MGGIKQVQPIVHMSLGLVDKLTIMQQAISAVPAHWIRKICRGPPLSGADCEMTSNEPSQM
jgi:hypothetical protein